MTDPDDPETPEPWEDRLAGFVELLGRLIAREILKGRREAEPRGEDPPAEVDLPTDPDEPVED